MEKNEFQENGVKIKPEPGFEEAYLFEYVVWSKLSFFINGTDGGCAGFGGSAGQIYAIGLVGEPKPSFFQESGVKHLS